MLYQRTVKNPIAFIGKGLFTGKDVQVFVYPSNSNNGITFKIDKCNKTRLSMKTKRMGGYYTSTCFSTGNGNIVMVEHLLSALAGNGIFNADIRVKPLFAYPKPRKGEPSNCFDIPILDGSALPIIQAMENNIKELNAPQRFIVPKETICFTEKGFGRHESVLEISPLKGEERNRYIIDINSLVQYNQHFSIDDCLCNTYNNQIAPCRTFGSIYYDKDIYKGANEENCIGYDPHTGAIYQGKEWLRFPDELVRHKLLDLIGDLSMLGYPIQAKIETINPSHDFNRHFCEFLFNRCRDKFNIV